MTEKWIETIIGDLIRWSDVKTITYELLEENKNYTYGSYLKTNLEEKTDFLDISSTFVDFDGKGTSRLLEPNEIMLLHKIIVQEIEKSSEVVIVVFDIFEKYWEFFCEERKRILNSYKTQSKDA